MTTNAIAIFDIDGVIRDVGGSYRRAIADTVEVFTSNRYRPTLEDIDYLKAEGIWNNDWEASRELVYRFWESQGQERNSLALNYQELIAFFQIQYCGSDPTHWTGYITQEPLLVQGEYFQDLSHQGIGWGFFSGAPRGEAEYVLQGRLKLQNFALTAMEDAPDKPDPTGLFATVEQVCNQVSWPSPPPIIYAGDTVADLYTVAKAKAQYPTQLWIGVGILPPHVQSDPAKSDRYGSKLQEAGATLILNNIAQLTPEQIQQLIDQ